LFIFKNCSFFKMFSFKFIHFSNLFRFRFLKYFQTLQNFKKRKAKEIIHQKNKRRKRDYLVWARPKIALAGAWGVRHLLAHWAGWHITPPKPDLLWKLGQSLFPAQRRVGLTPAHVRSERAAAHLGGFRVNFKFKICGRFEKRLKLRKHWCSNLRLDARGPVSATIELLVGLSTTWENTVFILASKQINGPTYLGIAFRRYMLAPGNELEVGERADTSPISVRLYASPEGAQG
jgi:hypothetical protein